MAAVARIRFVQSDLCCKKFCSMSMLQESSMNCHSMYGSNGHDRIYPFGSIMQWIHIELQFTYGCNNQDRKFPVDLYFINAKYCNVLIHAFGMKWKSSIRQCINIKLFFLMISSFEWSPAGVDFPLKKHSNQRGGLVDTVLRVRCASIVKMITTGVRQEHRKVLFFLHS